MIYQKYQIHLMNGDVIEIAEDYKLPCEEGFVGMFERMKADDILTISTVLFGEAYIPKKNIAYFNTSGVEKVRDYYGG